MRLRVTRGRLRQLAATSRRTSSRPAPRSSSSDGAVSWAQRVVAALARGEGVPEPERLSLPAPPRRRVPAGGVREEPVDVSAAAEARRRRAAPTPRRLPGPPWTRCRCRLGRRAGAVGQPDVVRPGSSGPTRSAASPAVDGVVARRRRRRRRGPTCPGACRRGRSRSRRSAGRRRCAVTMVSVPSPGRGASSEVDGDRRSAHRRRRPGQTSMSRLPEPEVLGCAPCRGRRGRRPARDEQVAEVAVVGGVLRRRARRRAGRRPSPPTRVVGAARARRWCRCRPRRRWSSVCAGPDDDVVARGPGDRIGPERARLGAGRRSSRPCRRRSPPPGRVPRPGRGARRARAARAVRVVVRRMCVLREVRGDRASEV